MWTHISRTVDNPPLPSRDWLRRRRPVPALAPRRLYPLRDHRPGSEASEDERRRKQCEDDSGEDPGVALAFVHQLEEIDAALGSLPFRIAKSASLGAFVEVPLQDGMRIRPRPGTIAADRQDPGQASCCKSEQKAPSPVCEGTGYLIRCWSHCYGPAHLPHLVL